MAGNWFPSEIVLFLERICRAISQTEQSIQQIIDRQHLFSNRDPHADLRRDHVNNAWLPWRTPPPVSRISVIGSRKKNRKRIRFSFYVACRFVRQIVCRHFWQRPQCCSDPEPFDCVPKPIKLLIDTPGGLGSYERANRKGQSSPFRTPVRVSCSLATVLGSIRTRSALTHLSSFFRQAFRREYCCVW